MNDFEQTLLQKMIKLEEKLQHYESQISILEKQKNHYQNDFLEISRQLTNSMFFEKIQLEAKGLATASSSSQHLLEVDTVE